MQGAVPGRVELRAPAPSEMVFRATVGRGAEQRDRAFLAPQRESVHPPTGATSSPAAITSGMQAARYSTAAEALRARAAQGYQERPEWADLPPEQRSILVPISARQDREVLPPAHRSTAVEVRGGKLSRERRCLTRWQAEALPPEHQALTLPPPARRGQQDTHPAQAKCSTAAEEQRALAEQLCLVR